MFDNKTRWRFNLEKQTENENVTEIFRNLKQLVSFVSFQLCWIFRIQLEFHLSQKWISLISKSFQ